MLPKICSNWIRRRNSYGGAFVKVPANSYGTGEDNQFYRRIVYRNNLCLCDRAGDSNNGYALELVWKFVILLLIQMGGLGVVSVIMISLLH